MYVYTGVKNLQVKKVVTIKVVWLLKSTYGEAK